MRSRILLALAAALFAAALNGTTTAAPRVSILISDLHLGLGKTVDGRWHPYEDFRWPDALAGFLQAISKEYGDNIDLVIVGDFLELWQTPEDIPCDRGSADAGCTLAELADLAGRIGKAHSRELAMLGDFSRRGYNRLYVVPGNHDAGLLVPEVWKRVSERFGNPQNHVNLVASGIWQSADKQVVAEHGHQIGSDVNSYAQWPIVTTIGSDGTRFLVRPWGERFVQSLFNAEEKAYPIIDNLSPETAGVRYRMQDRGWAGSLADTAKFIVFNIFETSFTQKGDFLGGEDLAADNFNRSAAEKAGYRLFLLSLPESDPLRDLIVGESPKQVAMRKELNELIPKLSDDELHMLCRNAIRLTKSNPCTASLSALATKALIPKEWIFRSHLETRQQQLGGFNIFVYGHTHLWEYPWKVTNINGKVRTITVVNTGAFQRLVDDKGFIALANKKALTPSQALRELAPEDLQPCYGVVVVDHAATNVRARLRLWQMPEGGGQGIFREPGVSDCPINGAD
jgi:UDP-2,3-diacylglucosamine pyrophosphatase LpxH